MCFTEKKFFINFFLGNKCYHNHKRNAKLKGNNLSAASTITHVVC